MNRKWYAAAIPVALVAAIAAGFDANEKAPPEPPAPTSTDVRPQWKVGDVWVVESIADQTQARTAKPEKPKPVQWQFSVEKQEAVDKVDAVKVRVEAQVAGQQPQTAIWIDPKRMAVVQVQTQFQVQGEFRTMTEKYTHPGQQAAPVFVPVSAVPLDMPCFLEAGVKDTQFTYTATQPLPPGIKNADAGGFEFRVTQSTRAATAAELKAHSPAAFVKSVKEKPTVVFDIAAGKSRSVQMWQADLPWPVYSDNGRTKARLIKVTRAP